MQDINKQEKKNKPTALIIILIIVAVNILSFLSEIFPELFFPLAFIAFFIFIIVAAIVNSSKQSKKNNNKNKDIFEENIKSEIFQHSENVEQKLNQNIDNIEICNPSCEHVIPEKANKECKHCGAKNPNKAKRCDCCGNKLK